MTTFAIAPPEKIFPTSNATETPEQKHNGMALRFLAQNQIEQMGMELE